MTVKVLYFAWLRQKMGGKAGEEVTLPVGVRTVADLMTWLAETRPGFADAMRAKGVIRAAVNREYAGRDAPVGPNDEVAFFPPVTGG